LSRFTNPGLLTAAIWTDFNNDEKPDLVIAGDWQPVRFFENKNGKLQETDAGIKNNSGMWRSLQQADIDGDGDMDYVAGNIGWNNKYHVTAQHPMMFYAKDIDKNGSNDLVPSYYIMNSRGTYDLYPAIDRNQLAEEIPSVKKKYLLHKDYSSVTMQQLINDYGKEGWTQLICETTSSIWIENRGNKQFLAHALPLASQFAPANAIIADDLDHDGMIDLLLAGNEYHNEVNTGPYDASYGVFLKGDGKGSFEVIDPAASGFIVDGDVRSMKLIRNNGGADIIIGINNNRAKCFRPNTQKKAIAN
jgi:enediyne biosynthesis protein E4